MAHFPNSGDRNTVDFIRCEEDQKGLVDRVKMFSTLTTFSTFVYYFPDTPLIQEKCKKLRIWQC